MQETINITDKTQVSNFIKKIADEIKIPAVLALHGDLGSGKTTFTNLLAKKIGVKEIVTSPTFLIHKSYKIKSETLEHFDLYRLKKYEELVEIGFEENLSKKNIIIIEWPDKIKNIVKRIKKISPKRQIIKIYFYHTSDINERKIKVLMV